jgi:hypothetical protein
MTGVLGQALSITGFVFVMMLVIEYLNVLTSGLWAKGLIGSRWSQYLVAAVLGVTPGCLGAFAVVGLYSHGMLSVGALVAGMVATSGDEAFVMFAMVPRQAAILSAVLLVLGLLAGALTDLFVRSRTCDCPQLLVHDHEDCRCFNHGQIVRQLKDMSPVRGVLLLFLVMLFVAIAGGHIGPRIWNWIRVTTLALTFVAATIVGTVPEHFLHEHLWRHVVREHLPRIFLWTFGTLLVLHLLTEYLQLEGLIRESYWAVLLIACLVGLIPESGPHLIFLTLYVQGSVPFSVLLASSIVQDGHGMLPLLAHSRTDFVRVKLINLVIGFGVGALLLLLGF